MHFPAKEELIIDAEPFALDNLSKHLAERAPSESALDALRSWMATTMAEAETSEAELDWRIWERRALRAHIINAEPELGGRARASYFPFERVLAEAIGRDLGQPAHGLIPRLVALSAVAGLREIYERDEASLSRFLQAPLNSSGLWTR